VRYRLQNCSIRDLTYETVQELSALRMKKRGNKNDDDTYCCIVLVVSDAVGRKVRDPKLAKTIADRLNLVSLSTVCF
jgi:hypothetical protein